MSTRSELLREGVRVVQGTPAEALSAPTLFLRLWRLAPPNGQARSFASLTVVRPSRDGYVSKELISELEASPRAAIDQAIAVARRGAVDTIYLNADLARLVPPRGRRREG
jgi:hypothetical protein